MKNSVILKGSTSNFDSYTFKSFIILSLLTLYSTFAQVGINTTTPDASAVLEVHAPNKGVLVPRVNLPNITTTMLDGVNTAANGLLIYNTNASTLGGDGVGFYTFNGTTWEKILTSSSSGVGSDHDFYEEGTSTAPDDITDDVFRMGHIAIGKNTATYILDIEDNSAFNRAINLSSTGTTKTNFSNSLNVSIGQAWAINNVITGSGAGESVGIRNQMSRGGTGNTTGLFNRMSNPTGIVHGVSNEINGSNNGAMHGIYTTIGNNGSGAHYGMNNTLSGFGNGFQYGALNFINNTGNGSHYGTFNALGGSGDGIQYAVFNNMPNSGTGTKYGVYNQMGNSSDADHYGVYTSFLSGGTGNKYGSYVIANPIISGTHYGFYSEVLRAGSFAGYFLGNVSIGTTSANNYTFPPSRGVANQVMQTDAIGNVNWVDTSNFGDHDFYEFGTTTAPDNINDAIFTNGSLGINYNPTGTALAADAQTDDIAIFARKDINSDTSSLSTGVSSLFTGAYPSGMNSTRNLYLSTNVTNSNGGTPTTRGINNVITATNIRVVGMETAIDLSGSISSSEHIGHNISFIGTGTGNKTGYHIDISENTSGDKIGYQSEINNGPDNKTGAIFSLGGAGALRERGVQVSILNGANAPEQTAYTTQLGANASNIKKGFEVELYNGTGGTQYGTYITLGNGAFGNNADLYGTYVFIPSLTNSNTQYGIYSDVRKATGYAGYFLGRFSIGTSQANSYILPASRGTVNQIMQTDGSGNVSWVNNPSESLWTRTGTNLDVATVADDIHFTSDQTSITFAQSSGTPSSMIYMFDGGTSNVDRMVLSHSTTYPDWGLEYEDTGDSFIFKSDTAEKVEISLNGGYPLRVYGTARAVDFETDTSTYPDYVFESYFNDTSEINPEYQFKSLYQVASFIEKNGHLPGVKSYEEVKADGMSINLAETTITNLEKIEELYLYVIELKKENDALKKSQILLEEKLSKVEGSLKK